jgi:hypothetical protein
MFSCPVCRYAQLREQPYDEYGCATYSICPCCGTEFGYDDSIKTHIVLREKWISLGMPWWSTHILPPDGWNPVQQLHQSTVLPQKLKMNKRFITVPKDHEAEIALDLDEAKSEQLIEVVLDDIEFKTLWENDFFESINAIANSNIDDYESESIIESEKLKEIANSSIFTNKLFDENLSKKVNEIRNVFFEAINRGTGVYFFF